MKKKEIKPGDRFMVEGADDILMCAETWGVLVKSTSGQWYEKKIANKYNTNNRDNAFMLFAGIFCLAMFIVGCFGGYTVGYMRGYKDNNYLTEPSKLYLRGNILDLPEEISVDSSLYYLQQIKRQDTIGIVYTDVLIKN